MSGSGTGIGLQVVLVFFGALLLYAISFSLIEGARQAKGPWQVTFRTDAVGQPEVSVTQPTLGLSNVHFVFRDARIQQTNFSRTILFDTPITNVPFGRVVFLDTTFLPGTVTLDLFGHEIEFLPRTLVLDRKEVSWKSGARFELKNGAGF